MSPQKRPPGVMLFFSEIRPVLALLTYEESGRAFEALLEYGQNGTEPVFEGNLAKLWPFFKKIVDSDIERYLEIRKKRKAAADKRWGNLVEDSDFPSR